MKKIISILIIMLLLIITGCSNKKVIKNNYTYKGENEAWSAEYKVNGIGTFTEKNDKTEYESNSNSILKVTYKKDLAQLSSVKQLEISFKSSPGDGKIMKNYNDGSLKEKTYIIKSSSENGAIDNKDEVIKVNINLDGKVQTIELKNVN